MTQSAEFAPLTTKEKIGYGLGDMASNFYLGFFGLFLLYYYTDVYGLAPAAVGLMLLISKIVDAVSDPGMGLIADRTDSRWGKYRPYLLWGAIPYGLLGFAIFFGPNFSETGRLIYAYVTYIGVMLAFTVMNVPYSALLAVISPSAEERTKATTYRLAFAGAGGLLVAAFATPLTRWLGGGDDVLGFRLTMAIFAVLSIALFWITFATTRERIKTVKHNTSVKNDFGVLLKNRSWVFLAISSVILVVALVARFASVIYYVKYYMGDDGQPLILIFDRVALFNSLGLFGQIVGASCTPFLVKYFDKHRLVLVMSLLHAALLVMSFFTPPEQYWFSVFLHFLGITTFGVTITLLFAMYTDCAEYGEWKTGKRISGLTVSASLFSLKFGSAMGGAIPGFILGAIGFVANQVQTPDTLLGIRLMATILPAALFFLGGLALLFYKIDRRLLLQMEFELAANRAHARQTAAQTTE
ncbi:MAG: MFS transporter [Paraglaciecola sp.]|nr:MFS transporter [Paraglaciecola sp.]